jgi:hypothetical protein
MLWSMSNSEASAMTGGGGCGGKTKREKNFLKSKNYRSWIEHHTTVMREA